MVQHAKPRPSKQAEEEVGSAIRVGTSTGKTFLSSLSGPLYESSLWTSMRSMHKARFHPRLCARPEHHVHASSSVSRLEHTREQLCPEGYPVACVILPHALSKLLTGCPCLPLTILDQPPSCLHTLEHVVNHLIVLSKALEKPIEHFPNTTRGVGGNSLGQMSQKKRTQGTCEKMTEGGTGGCQQFGRTITIEAMTAIRHKMGLRMAACVRCPSAPSAG